MSSEEKLLNLIRKKDKSESQQKKIAQSQVNQKSNESNSNALKFVNQILIVIVVGLGAYLVVTFFTKSPQEVNLEPKLERVKAVPVEVAVLEAKPFSDYEDTLKSRNIFQSPWEKPAKEKALPEKTSRDLSSEIKVVGIVLDKDPKAIVEDIKGKKTHFLSIGERIKGAVLKEVQAEKVIFRYENEDVILKP